MKTTRLAFPCPVCGSADVFYSCTPNCCFNHVCGACGATFEPATRVTGEIIKNVIPPDPLPESTDPTTECAKCNSVAVFALDNDRLVCGTCGAVLLLEMTEIAPDSAN